jgi:regulatory protein
MDDPVRSAFADGLAMLARRELSEAQLRDRLARRDHPPAGIDAAIERLRVSGALDDRRVALSRARTEARVKSRGRARVLRLLESLGIASDVAASAVDEVFGALDESDLLGKAVARRLRGPSATIRDAAHFRRLHQQLVRQGFPPSAVFAALKARGRRDTTPDSDGE